MTGPGHNTELTPDERRALFFHHLQKVMRAHSKSKEANDNLKAEKNIAKASGIPIMRLNKAISVLTAEDQEKVAGNFRGDAEVLAWLGVIPSNEGTLFENREQPEEERAYQAGFAAGLLAQDPAPPHAAETTQHQKWMGGWHDAQKKMRNDLHTAMQKNALRAQAEDAADEADEAEESGDEPEDEAA